MKVYNLTDVAPHPMLVSRMPRQALFQGYEIVPGEYEEISDEVVIQKYRDTFPQDFACGEIPDWYADLKGIKKEPPKPAKPAKKRGRPKKSDKE